MLEDGTHATLQDYYDVGKRGNIKSFYAMKSLDGHHNVAKVIAYGTLDRLRSTIPAKLSPHQQPQKGGLVVELLANGTLLSRIHQGAFYGKKNEHACKKTGMQLLDGLIHMHERGVAHNAIAPDNVAFKEDVPKYIGFD